MDVCGIFLGDTTLSYGSMRNSVYRDYEQFPYGTLENCKTPVIKDSYSRVQEKCQQTKSQKTGKQPCPFCKEHKKRPLISYLRKKNFQNNNEKICEEIEEEDEDEHHEHHHHEHSEKHEILVEKETDKNHKITKKTNLEFEFGPKKNIQI